MLVVIWLLFSGAIFCYLLYFFGSAITFRRGEVRNHTEKLKEGEIPDELQINEIEKIWPEVLKDKTYSGSIRRTKPTGVEVWLMATFSPVKDEQGTICKVYILASTFYPDTGKEYKSINFTCQKSGVYTVMISFKEGKAGEVIGIMSYITK